MNESPQTASIVPDYSDDEDDIKSDDIQPDLREASNISGLDTSEVETHKSASADGTSSTEEVDKNMMGKLSKNLKRALDDEAASFPIGKRISKYAVDHTTLSSELRLLLCEVSTFFTKPLNLQRMKPAISRSTMEKVHERICCFLGYAIERRNYISPSEMTEEIFEDANMTQDYLNYLDEERKLNPSTISNHASALLYVHKYLHRNLAPQYQGVEIISQLRNVATQLQKEGDVKRPKTTNELRAAGKWLTWGEILSCVELQKQTFDVAKGKQKAKAMQDLLLITVYCHMPPSRGLEIRTLCLFEESSTNPFNIDEVKDQNILLKESNGDFTFHFNVFKTSKYMGHDEVTVERGSELNHFLGDFVRKYRGALMSNDSGDFVFLNSCGKPFTSPSFTKNLQAIFYRLSGVKVSINCLRSSFVTHAYSNGNCSESLKKSLALALRHTQRQAEKTYDRRTRTEKKGQALEFARSCAESHSSFTEDGEAPSRSSNLKPGTFVACAESDSSVLHPKIIVGRVLNLAPNSEEVVLLWYKHVKGDTYKLAIDGSKWQEREGSLIPVKMSPVKGKHDLYELKTCLAAIHRKVFGE